MCLYELLLKRSSRFKTNRIYLFVAIAAGIIIPLLPLKQPVATIAIENGIGIGRQYLVAEASTVTAETTQQQTTFWSVARIAWSIYLTGMAISLSLFLWELITIFRNAVYSKPIIVAGYKIFSSSRPHAPYSFMGWIFIYQPERYSEEGLQFILAHEDAHNKNRHWLDMLLLQTGAIIFWFHPLLWRFRYLVKLNHEFAADQIAAGDKAFEYGHFLLEQTLLKGTPKLAHSFHFSPIKESTLYFT